MIPLAYIKHAAQRQQAYLMLHVLQQVTEDEAFRANALGWCVEWVRRLILDLCGTFQCHHHHESVICAVASLLPCR